MNVANPVSMIQAAAPRQAVLGGAGGLQPATAGLFALSLAEVVASNGEIPALPAAPADAEDAKEGQWDELLALLEQWLAAAHAPGDWSAKADRADPAEGFAAVVQTAPAGGGTTPEPLVAMFMKAGLPRQQAEELARALAALVKSGDANRETRLAELPPLVRQWLKPLAEGEARVGARQEVPMLTRMAQRENIPVLPTTRVAVDTPSVEAPRDWHALRVNRALGAYQAEMVTTVRTAVRTVETPASLNVPSSSAEGVLSGQTAIEEGQAMLVLPRLTTEPPVPAAPQVPIRETVRADRFAEDVQALFVRQLKIDAAANGITHARLILHPQSLGQVQVTITADNGVITAHFAADTAAGRELLDNQMSQLRHALAQHGIQVEKLVVTQQPQQEQAYGFQEQRGSQQQHSQQEQPHRQQSHARQPEISFDELVEGWRDSDEGAAGWLSGSLNASA